MRKTIEQWKLELLPQPRSSLGWSPQEELKVGSKDWLYNSAKILNKWAIGEELTKEEFEIVKSQCLNMTDSADVDFAKYMESIY
jgi:hypothetical protein